MRDEDRLLYIYNILYIYNKILFSLSFPLVVVCADHVTTLTTLTTPCHWGRSVGLIMMVENAWGGAMFPPFNLFVYRSIRMFYGVKIQGWVVVAPDIR